MGRHWDPDVQPEPRFVWAHRPVSWGCGMVLTAGVLMGVTALAVDSAPAVQAVEAPRPPVAASTVPPVAGPLRPVFDFADVMPWDPGKGPLPSPATVGRPQPTSPVGTPSAPREQPESPAPVVPDPPEAPAPTQPPAPAPEPVTVAPASPPPVAAPGLVDLVNRDRSAAGCGPVAVHPELTGQAQAHSDLQAADDVMRHSDGVSGFDTSGENVASGYDTAAEVHDAWMASPGHRANILDCGYTLIGFGVTDGRSGRYWTEMFAA